MLQVPVIFVHSHFESSLMRPVPHLKGFDCHFRVCRRFPLIPSFAACVYAILNPPPVQIRNRLTLTIKWNQQNSFLLTNFSIFWAFSKLGRSLFWPLVALAARLRLFTRPSLTWLSLVVEVLPPLCIALKLLTAICWDCLDVNFYGSFPYFMPLLVTAFFAFDNLLTFFSYGSLAGALSLIILCYS